MSQCEICSRETNTYQYCKTGKKHLPTMEQTKKQIEDMDKATQVFENMPAGVTAKLDEIIRLLRTIADNKVRNPI
jgi:hypothetical protein